MALPPAEYGSPVGLPALQEAIAGYLGRARGLACGPDDVVITAGASQALDLIARAALTPALRVGYLVAPAPLRRRVEGLKRAADNHTPWPVEQALAAFIVGGRLDRHIQRMRRHYTRKRAAFAATLAPVGLLATVRGHDAGLHTYLELHHDLDLGRIVRQAQARGVIVMTLDTYYVVTPDRRGLLLGYGGLDECDVVRGAGILADVIAREARDARRQGHPVSCTACDDDAMICCSNTRFARSVCGTCCAEYALTVAGDSSVVPPDQPLCWPATRSRQTGCSTWLWQATTRGRCVYGDITDSGDRGDDPLVCTRSGRVREKKEEPIDYAIRHGYVTSQDRTSVA